MLPVAEGDGVYGEVAARQILFYCFDKGNLGRMALVVIAGFGAVGG